MPEKKVDKKSRKTVKTRPSKEEALDQLQSLVSKEKWNEQDFGSFVRISSDLLRLNEKEAEKFYSILIQVPHTHLPRILYYIANQRFIDFISGKNNASFRFTILINKRLTQLIRDWSNIEEDIQFLDSGEDIKLILSKKIQSKSIKSPNNLRQLEWDSLKKIEKVRLLYSLIVLQGGLDSTRVGQMQRSILVLLEVFVGQATPGSNNKSQADYEANFRKLKIYFNEIIKGSTSEETIKNLYMLESISNVESRNLVAERDNLARTSQSQKERIEAFTIQLNEAENKIEESRKIIESKEEEIAVLKKSNQELEKAYSRLQEAATVATQSEINSLVARINRDLKHQFLKLQRGLDKHIQDERIHAQFRQIMLKIENIIQLKE